MNYPVPHFAVVFLVAAMAAPGSYAKGPGKTVQGFSGRVQAGVAHVTKTDQLDTDANKKLDDLGSNADRYHDVLPLLLFDLRYTFAPSGRQIYFRTPQDEGGPPRLTLGAVLPFEDGSALDVSAFGKPFEEVWKDPYLLGQQRADTRRSTYGAKLAYSDILGTPVGISYSVAHADVDDDEIGRRFSDLERDGWLHQARLEYEYPLSRGIAVVPGFEFSLTDLDDNAESYKGYEFSLGLRAFAPNYQVILTASVGVDDYDDRHPVFNESRDDDNYSVFGVFTLTDLLGRESLFASLIAGYQHRDSNIGFLKSDTFLSGLTVGYRF